MDNKELISALSNLTKQEERIASLGWTFLRGIAYGFGAVVGSGLLVALFAWILSFFNSTPVIGDYISQIVNIVKQKTGQ